MKTKCLLTLAGLVVCLAPASPVFGQVHAETQLLFPPDPQEADLQQAGDKVRCSIAFSAANGDCVFGVSELKGATPPGQPVEFIISSQTPPFNIFRIDENCNILSSWSTVSVAGGLTGLAFDTNTGNTYWMMQQCPLPKQMIEFQMGSGQPTGRSCLVGNAGVKGPMCTNDNSGVPNDFYFEDISQDTIFQIDPVTCTFGCSFANPDNAGVGAFGNGIDDAADTSTCGEMVVTSGTINEGRVVRVGQLDCANPTPLPGCSDTWNLLNSLGPTGASFHQGVAEFIDSQQTKCLAVNDGNVNMFFIVHGGRGLHDCQGIDNEELVTVNFSRGGVDRVFFASANGPYTARVAKPAAGGRGKFVFNANAGTPNDSTITTLPSSLGDICFDPLIPHPPTLSIIANNIGRRNRIGSSMYFGTPVPDPPRAPAIAFQNGAGDTANMPAGSCWTLQAVILNPAATSPRGGSVTNAVLLVLQ